MKSTKLPKSEQGTAQEKEDATPPQSPKSGSLTPKAESDTQARPAQDQPTTPPTLPLSPDLNPRTSLQRRREKTQPNPEKTIEASINEPQRPPSRRRLPDAPIPGYPTVASRPSLQRSVASLGKRRLKLKDNPNNEPLGKKRNLGLADIREDGEATRTADDGEMLLSRLGSPDLSRPSPVPQRRLRCTECEDWDIFCSLEDNPNATSPCGSCDRRKRFCVEQIYAPRPPGWRAGGGIGIGDEERDQGGRDEEAGSRSGTVTGTGTGIRMRGGGSVDSCLGTVLGTLLGKLWAGIKMSWMVAKSLMGMRMANT